MSRDARIVALGVLLAVLCFGLLSQPVNAGPAADQIGLLEERLAATEAKVTALEGEIELLKPRPTPVPTPVPTPTPTPSPTPQPAPSGILLVALATRPASGPAWDALLSTASSTWPAPDLMNQDSRHQLYVLAAAFVYARNGDTTMQAKARNGILAALPTFHADTTNGALSLGRQLPAYVIAASLIGLDDPTFRADLVAWRDGTVGTHGRWSKLGFTCSDSSNNWGAHACAAVIAIDKYLGNDLSADWAIFRGFTGDRSAHTFGPVSIAQPSWVVASTWTPVQIAPGDPRDGAVTEDAWRSGAYPTISNTYVMDSAQALGLQAELLGGWSYLNRSSGFLVRQSSVWTNSGGRGGRSLAYLYNARLGLGVPTTNTGDRFGWSFGFMDWLYQ